MKKQLTLFAGGFTILYSLSNYWNPYYPRGKLLKLIMVGNTMIVTSVFLK
jgi:hypothetical protein